MSKVGRNTPCQCGSGKKHKECCLQTEDETASSGKQAGSIAQRQAQLLLARVNAAIGADELASRNQHFLESVKQQFERFKERVRAGRCPNCFFPLDSRDQEAPCLHWLLNGERLQKRTAEQALAVAKDVGFVRFEAFLRWSANLTAPMRYINDLPDPEKNMVIEETIVFGETELSLSCSENDFCGHPGSLAQFPHYHFQMRFKGQTVVKYNDNHLPFTEYDLLHLELIRNHPDKVKHVRFYDAGMSQAFSLDPKQLIATRWANSAPDQGDVCFQTLVSGEGDSLVSGDLIADAIEQSKRTGRPIAAILHENQAGLNVQTIISEGPSVPEVAERQGGRRNRKR